jgi:pimeloyl-CoA dehydrogenase small subunit
MWGRYAEMGLMALPFAEEDGGLGGTPVETMIVMEALGKALVLEPYFPTVVLGGGLLRFGGSAGQRAEFIPQLAAGEAKLAFGHTERNSRFDLNHVETAAKKDGDGWLLSGQKSVVLGGDMADHIFVTARTGGGARDENGIGVFMIDAMADGLSRRGYANQDGQRAAEITLENVRVPAERVIGDPENGLPLVRRVVDAGISALCAEAIGAMGAMHALTVEYLKVRKQFGVPIGAFQVLQHKAVDMFVALEQARSITLYATMMADSEDAEERGRAMHAAKAEVGKACRLVGETAIQLHGGVGMTMEYAVGHYFKRATMIDLTFGDHDHHLRRLAERGGLFAAA